MQLKLLYAKPTPPEPTLVPMSQLPEALARLKAAGKTVFGMVAHWPDRAKRPRGVWEIQHD